MASRWNVQEQGSKRRRTNQNTANVNRKSTDTSANSGKTINRPAQTAKPVQQKKTVYYRSKDDARPVYRNPAKQKTVSRPRYTGKGRTTPKLSGWYAQPKQAAQKAPKLTKKWGVNFWNDLDRVKRGERMENYTPQSRLIDDSPKEQMKRDLAPGSNYRMRNWINSRAKKSQEDRGSTLAQVNRLAALYGAVDPITGGFTREQAGDIHRQIQKAPVNLQEMYIKYGDKLSPMVDLTPNPDDVLPPDQGAYYSPSTGRVYGEPDVIANDTRFNVPYRTLWHEYGHNLDDLAGDLGYGHEIAPNYSAVSTIGDRPQLGNLIREDVDESLRDYWNKVRLGNEPYGTNTAMRYFSQDMQEAFPQAVKYSAGLSDMMGQVGRDNAPLGFGHTKDYWGESRSRKPAEAFANLSAASVLGGRSQRYIQAVLPNTYEAYLAMLEDMAKR